MITHETTGIHCPDCKRHILVEHITTTNFADEDDDRNRESCEAVFACPKCGRKITAYGSTTVKSVKLTGTKIPSTKILQRLGT